MINLICGIFALIGLIGCIFGFAIITKKWKDYKRHEKISNIVLLFVIFMFFFIMVILTIYPKFISTL